LSASKIYGDWAAMSEVQIIDDSLSALQRRFVMHWGEMGARWGVNRTVSQIHALLFITGKAMSAEELADTLQVARSNVSNSLRELQNLQLVRVIHRVGDRRDWYETSTDVWVLLRTITEQRKLREFDPTMRTLRELMESEQFAGEDKEVQQRVKDTHALMTSLSNWGDEMLRLDPATLQKILKLGGKIQKLLRDSGAIR
jgi:DNA-binding transcriptional regulator GbsR (MarR family)